MHVTIDIVRILHELLLGRRYNLIGLFLQLIGEGEPPIDAQIGNHISLSAAESSVMDILNPQSARIY